MKVLVDGQPVEVKDRIEIIYENCDPERNESGEIDLCMKFEHPQKDIDECIFSRVHCDDHLMSGTNHHSPWEIILALHENFRETRATDIR